MSNIKIHAELICARNYSHSDINQESILLEMKISVTKDRKVCVEIRFDLGNNRHHMPSGLSGRLIVVVRQKGRQTPSSLEFFKKFENFILKHI